MSLPIKPIIKKFFSNKIESSRDDWYGYLIRIARILYEFDGQEYNRDVLLQKFSTMSHRNSQTERDAANFRDEFGAYGTYLGLFHFEKIDGIYKIVVSNAAKQFLCTENPNAAAFCRTQLALFQYPNGAGATVSTNGGISVQGNIRTDTVRELIHNIHLNPLRIICRIVVALHEYLGKKLNDIAIPYDFLFCIFNDDRINQTYNPTFETIQNLWTEFNDSSFRNLMEMDGLTNFKRNFHILEKTGLFIRDSRFGILISHTQTQVAYSCIKVIADMTESFDAFNEQFVNPSEDLVKNVIISSAWGQYYDSGNLPITLLEKLGLELDSASIPTKAFSQFIANASSPVCGYENDRIATGENILLYGVPGSGKSWTIAHEYCKKNTKVERLVFHPDYTYAEFVGQILPDVQDGEVTYKFMPGSFTSILRDAYQNPADEYILIIEEVNRGNAPAIFGEVFQLLDRMTESKTINEITYSAGTSEYDITNKDMALEIYGDESHKIRIPSNLSIIGTMNTSDQNVFTLDTAFQRRWNMRLIENSFKNVHSTLADAEILDTGVTWQHFCETVNNLILDNKNKLASAEDKRLGVYFVHENDLKYDKTFDRIKDNLSEEYDRLLVAENNSTITDEEKKILEQMREMLKQNRKFAEKVIKYLWDDAFKFNTQDLFDSHFNSLESIIRHFVFSSEKKRFEIFQQNVSDKLFGK